MSAVPQGPYNRVGPETPGAPGVDVVIIDYYAQLPTNAKLTLVSIPPGRGVDMILGPNPPVLSGGGGGWQTTARWGRRSITSWQGIDGLQLDFTCWFDASFSATKDIEAQCAELQSMYAPRGDFNAPRHVRLIGPSPAPDIEWLMNDLVWRPEAQRTNFGLRTQQQFDIKLIEFVDPDSVLRATAQASNASNRSRIYTVKAGDTLVSIARTQLGNAKFADDIRRANLPALADARSLKKGMQILLPAGRSQTAAARGGEATLA